ncbi:gamma-aminobutyric acid receptor subunit alpha [Mytilus galloprovincialis]|uniref:Gamma-aminobutyric acid receptor subunit alpha n=1 Tax=Mytilus galloprovincialis TaxID=29158 RepID=A0A8B6G8K9_MYTGA|nr:gamma-aminobutyric acid receptor subunit alpha [Mytilus galloprovincialis]
MQNGTAPLSTRLPDMSFILWKLIESKTCVRSCTLIAYDVTSMYTNMNIDNLLDTTKNFLDQIDRTKYKVPNKSDLISFAKNILENNEFQFNGTLYKQVIWAPQGGILLPTATDLHLSTILTKILDRFQFKNSISMICQYRDDGFMITECNKSQIDEFFAIANNIDPLLKFTYNFSNTEVTYLDTEVYRGERFISNGVLDIRLHVKQTETYQYLPFTRAHPKHTFRSIITVAYSEDDVKYTWNSGKDASVARAPDMTMSQFDLINFSAETSFTYRKDVRQSMLTVYFNLRRHTGYFVINIFVPCMLLVILSWVSFWINREATSDRIALGTTTVLTMAFLALDSRSDLPRVKYATALDLYIALCFVFILSAIVQFAIVHRFTKHGHGDVEPSPTDNDDEDEETEDETVVRIIYSGTEKV